MIRSIYLEFGFGLTLLICLSSVFLFIFWMAGIAGIIANPDEKRKVGWSVIIFCVFIPIYPILWLLMDTFKEFNTIRKHTLNTQNKDD